MSSLGEFHTQKKHPAKAPRSRHGSVIAVIVGAIGVYVFESGMLESHPPQAGQNYPRGM